MTDQFIEPGSEIVIGPVDHLVDILNVAAHEDYQAEVVWCHRCDPVRPDRFLIGVQFVRPLAH